MEFPTVIDMNLPVRVQGSLLYAGSSSANASLKDAVIAAYAMVRDEDGERAVPIGSATADENGRFTLLLPPSITARLVSQSLASNARASRSGVRNPASAVAPPALRSRRGQSQSSSSGHSGAVSVKR